MQNFRTLLALCGVVYSETGQTVRGTTAHVTELHKHLKLMSSAQGKQMQIIHTAQTTSSSWIFICIQF